MLKKLEQFRVTETEEILVSDEDKEKFIELWEDECVLFYDENYSVYTESSLRVGDILGIESDMPLSDIKVSNIKAENLVKVFQLFESSVAEEVFVDRCKEKTYTLMILKGSTGENNSFVSEEPSCSSTNLFFNVYTDKLSLSDIRELEGSVEKAEYF